jgi:2,4-dienoyl-CoA reductase-like NADH-dependent reductase (Old Yellow Enzyme family)
LHGAHGFLIQNFFSPLFNQRGDDWGGSLENRMRFPLAVVGEVKRIIELHTELPFLLGYRISPEESGEGGLRINDTYELLDHLTDGGVDYIHVSLSSVLDAKPIEDTSGQAIAELIVKRVGGRVPVIAAGRIRKPEQAETALELGLSLVAVGQGLVMNPEWVDLAESEKVDEIDTALDPSEVSKIVLPDKLWKVIHATTGWFEIRT